jgi:tetratricopeptide (TPR) repeat protein
VYYANRGYVHFRIGSYYGENPSEFDEAIADYTQAIKLAPNEAWNFRGRADAYLEQKEYDKAIADINEAIRLDPDYDYHKTALEEAEAAKADAED